MYPTQTTTTTHHHTRIHTATTTTTHHNTRIYTATTTTIPLLPRHAAGARDLTPGEADVVREACLAAFDDRQADRRRLLSLRLAECEAELARLQAIELAHISPADKERVRAEEAAAGFRLRVVQRRMEEHEPAAAERRAELEARLGADRRLAAALAPA